MRGCQRPVRLQSTCPRLAGYAQRLQGEADATLAEAQALKL
ncbi:MAG: hypothetical protein WCW68_00470 [Methanothrix sp.]